jgi:hypothetical protein
MPVPDFSPGEVLTAAAMDSIGLWLVKTQTIGTGVASVNVPDAFSSTYDNYKILISGGAGSQSVELNMRLGATVTNYHFNFVFTAWNATVAADGSKVATSFQYVGGMSANGIIADIDVMSQNLAKTSRIGAFAAGQEVSYAGTAIGGLFNTTQYTDFTILAAAGTMTGGTIRVYGYRK